tara:strand:+ start:273 stop:1085 length:813 start_codon:yes stop_codon:yes gene_type:complete
MAFGDPTVTDFDDDAGSPEDYGLTQTDLDFASLMGRTSATGGTDAERLAIANYIAQPQVGRNRTNIRGTKNFDPDYAAALKISRGLNPGGIQSILRTPTYLQPQIPGQRVDARGDAIMYYSPVERYMQEVLPTQIQELRNVSPIGIMQNLIDYGTRKYNETFRDDKKEEKSDVGIMQNMDRADATDVQKALRFGYENNPFSGPATQMAGLDMQDIKNFISNPGVVGKALDYAQPFIQNILPEDFKVDTGLIFNPDKPEDSYTGIQFTKTF